MMESDGMKNASRCKADNEDNDECSCFFKAFLKANAHTHHCQAEKNDLTPNVCAINDA